MLGPSAKHWVGQKSIRVVQESGLQELGSPHTYLQALHTPGPHLGGLHHTEPGCLSSRIEYLVLVSCLRGYAAPEQPKV